MARAAAVEMPRVLEVSRTERRALAHERKSALVQKHFQSVRTVAHVLETYKERGLRYQLVGSLVLEAQLGARYAPVCKDGRMRDIDVVILEDPKHAVNDVKKELQQLIDEKQVICEVDFIISKPAGYRDPKQLVPHLKATHDARVALAFRDIEVPLPPWANATVRASITGPDSSSFEFDAEPPQTIYALYWAGFGVMRPKDREHVRIAKKLAKKSGVDLEGDGSLRAAVSQFKKEVWKRYKHIVCAYYVYRKVNARFKQVFGRPLLPKRSVERMIQQ